MSDTTKTAAVEPITVQVTVSAVLVPEADGRFSMYVPTLPGCFVEADTIEEARAEVVDAIEGWLEAWHAGNAAEAMRALTEALPSEAARLLAEEIACYRRQLPEWVEHEGEHVLIKGSAVLGFHPTRDAALADGYRRCGRVPFLVKQVVRNEKPVTIGVIR